MTAPREDLARRRSFWHLMLLLPVGLITWLVGVSPVFARSRLHEMFNTVTGPALIADAIWISGWLIVITIITRIFVR